MTSGWQRTAAVVAASVAFLIASGIGAAVPASADGPAPSRGCAGVTPKKAWRLVASRPDPGASEVKVEWSAVGCTTGYRLNIVGTGVARQVDVSGGGTSSATILDLAPTKSYFITVTSIGANGDGGVSGTFRLHRSGPSAHADLSIDFPEAGPAEPVAPSDIGAGPWVNPELRWTAPTGPAPESFLVRVTGGGKTILEKTVPGSATATRLGESIAAGVPYNVTVTPVMADGSDGDTARLALGSRVAPRPEQVTGNAPVVQFSPVTDEQGVGYWGTRSRSGRSGPRSTCSSPPPASVGAGSPWVAVDPSFAAVDGSDTGTPMTKMVTVVRTITTMGTSAWTPAQTITHSDVVTADASYFAGIGHIFGSAETVPRNGLLNVRGSTADLQITDLVWSQAPRTQAIPVTIAVFGSGGSNTPAFTQAPPLTHLPDGAQDAWRASDIPLPDGWTSIVLRRGGADVAIWINTDDGPCVAAVTFADAATDLPEMWKDSWCTAYRSAGDQRA